MEDAISVGVIGIGFVGGAVVRSLRNKGITVATYDLHRESGEFEDVESCSVVFLCLPTQYDEREKRYDTQALEATCKRLHGREFAGVVLVKSTVEPGTMQRLAKNFPGLQLIHNPEFLTAATAQEDFDKQGHVVLGATDGVRLPSMRLAESLYARHYPSAIISKCTAMESESMKIFANSFYAVKIQFFNEMHAVCQKTGADYDRVRNMIVRNGWVNPMHTNVPGTDGKLSYGGLCFPKDTSALLAFMERLDTPRAVLQGTVHERNQMREDKCNVIPEENGPG
tara:strand:+ start:1144 stop:1989 length:846 start_codon:yes stop_codon:yes gene_type:complete